MPGKSSFKYMAISEPVTYSVENRKFRFLYFSPGWFIMRYLPALAGKIFRLYIDERIVEYPFIFTNLPGDKHSRILDVGSTSSKLPLELACLGYQVNVIDVRDYPFEHPNLTATKGDICRTGFEADSFDAVTLVSTLEHIGLGRWDDPARADGDRRAIEEITRILKPGGKVMITVPFGRRAVIRSKSGVPFHRVYDYQSLTGVLTGLHVTRMEYAAVKQGHWLPASLEEVKDTCRGETVDGVALVVAQK